MIIDYDYNNLNNRSVIILYVFVTILYFYNKVMGMRMLICNPRLF